MQFIENKTDTCRYRAATKFVDAPKICCCIVVVIRCDNKNLWGTAKNIKNFKKGTKKGLANKSQVLDYQLVPGAGFEPARPFGQEILSL